MDEINDIISSYLTSDQTQQAEVPISTSDYVADDQPIHAEDVTAAKPFQGAS